MLFRYSWHIVVRPDSYSRELTRRFVKKIKRLSGMRRTRFVSDLSRNPIPNTKYKCCTHVKLDSHQDLVFDEHFQFLSERIYIFSLVSVDTSQEERNSWILTLVMMVGK